LAFRSDFSTPHRLTGTRLSWQRFAHRHRRLLRARRERQRRRAAKQRYELAAIHSITSSAMASTPGGIVIDPRLA
jgi:hypothetical protein